MMSSNTLAGVQVRDGAADFEDAVVRAGGEAHFAHCSFHKSLGIFADLAILPEVPRLHLRVGVDAVTPETLLLDLSCLGHTFTDMNRRFSRSIICDLAELDRRHLDMNIDPVHERAGYAGPVGLDLVGRAETLMQGIAVKTALAGVCSAF